MADPAVTYACTKEVGPVPSMLKHAIIIVLTTMSVWLTYRLVRPQGRAHRGGSGLVAKPGRAHQLSLLLGLLLSSFMVFVAFRGPPTEASQRVPFVGLLVFFLLATVYFLLELIFLRINVSPEGLSIRSPWHWKWRLIRWADVRAVDFSAFMQWLVVRAHDGTTIRIGLLLDGIGSVASAIRKHVPADKLKAGAYAVVAEAHTDEDGDSGG